MKRWLFPFLLVLFLSFPSFVYAHFPATDGDMTVTMHVDPDDDPTPGQQANIYFLFDDVTKRFSLEKCNCMIKISQEGKQIFKGNLVEKHYAHPSIWGTHMPYVFPQSDVYHIVLVGKPNTIGAFQSFTLSWDFRVDPDGGDAGIVIQRPSDLPFLLGATAAGIIFLTFLGWFFKKNILDAEELDNIKKSNYNKKR
jgi:hypothetical protein